jgi:hypothetical protein
MSRTALLLRMTRDEAEKVRSEAAKCGENMNAYVLSVAMRAAVEDRPFFATIGSAAGELHHRMPRSSDPKRALLIRCSVNEVSKIREAASRRKMTIVGFLRQSLRTTWQTENKRKETADGEVVMAPAL